MPVCAAHWPSMGSTCFTMMMVVDLAGCQGSFEQLRTDITAYGEARDLSLRIQREDIFDAMHKL